MASWNSGFGAFAPALPRTVARGRGGRATGYDGSLTGSDVGETGGVAQTVAAGGGLSAGGWMTAKQRNPTVTNARNAAVQLHDFGCWSAPVRVGWQSIHSRRPALDKSGRC